MTTKLEGFDIFFLSRYGHVSISSFDHRRSSVERSLSSPSGLGNGGGGDNNVEEGVSLLNGRRRPLDRNACSRQTSSSLGFCLGAFAMGNMLGWPSTALPNLEASNRYEVVYSNT